MASFENASINNELTVFSPLSDQEPQVDFDQLTQELPVAPEAAEANTYTDIDAEIKAARFSVASLGKYRKYLKYLNPIEAGKGYGRFLKNTVKEFGVPEVVGIASMYGMSYLAQKYGGAMGTWANPIGSYVGETAGFYGATYLKRYRELRHDQERTYSRQRAVIEAGRHTLGLFSIAELVDLPTRPFMMYAMQNGMGMGPEAATTAGKIAADHVYAAIGLPLAKHLRHKASERYDARIEKEITTAAIPDVA
jgi:hypothetical protein